MCKYKTHRTKNKIAYCRLKKEWNPICYTCEEKAYKEYKPLTSKTPLKKMSKRQSLIERKRISLLTLDLTKSIESGLPKDDLHEIFDGKNRLKSIKYGLVIPLTRKEHSDPKIIKKWQKIGRQIFIDKYGSELFIKEFQTKKGLK